MPIKIGGYPKGSPEDVYQRLLADAALPRYGFCFRCFRIRHLLACRQGDSINGKEIEYKHEGIRWTCPHCLHWVRLGWHLPEPEVLDEISPNIREES